MNLETIKNTYAQEKGYEDWDELATITCYTDGYQMESYMNEICIRAQKLALEKASDNLMYKTVNDRFAVIDRTSITNPENLIL